VRSIKLLLLMLTSVPLLLLAANGEWLKVVPAREHARTNPLRGQPDAVAAGGRLYAEHCAKCHGKNAQGLGKAPSLRSLRVQQQATEGDLHWLLVNGNLRRGMPSWSKLPDPERWQIISYLKSLGP
jgi:mono/diheme cytochrome c family protein